MQNADLELIVERVKDFLTETLPDAIGGILKKLPFVGLPGRVELEAVAECCLSEPLAPSTRVDARGSCGRAESVTPDSAAWTALAKPLPVRHHITSAAVAARLGGVTARL